MIKVKEYVKPDTVEAAYELGQMDNSIYVSGGLMVAQLKISNAERIIDLKSLGWTYIKESDQEFKIGANTKISDLLSNPSLAHLNGDFIKNSVKEIGSTQIRNMATIGGSVAFKLGWSDMITILIALDSDVQVYDGKISKISVEEYTEKRMTGAIIKEIDIPKKAGIAVFEKFAKSNFDIATLNLGLKIVFEGKIVKDVRVVVGSRPMVSKRIKEVEEFLIGKNVKDSLEEACDLIEKVVRVGTDIRASAEYRKALAKALLEKALRRSFL